MAQLSVEQIEAAIKKANGESVHFWVIDKWEGPGITHYFGWYDSSYEEISFKDSGNDLMDDWHGAQDFANLGPVFTSFVEAAQDVVESGQY